MTELKKLERLIARLSTDVQTSNNEAARAQKQEFKDLKKGLNEVDRKVDQLAIHQKHDAARLQVFARSLGDTNRALYGKNPGEGAFAKLASTEEKGNKMWKVLWASIAFVISSVAIYFTNMLL